MKIFKHKLHLGVLSKGKLILPMVLAFAFWCVNTEVEAQIYSELDGSTIEMLEQAFEEEKAKLMAEINDPPQGLSLEANRNLYFYYEAVIDLYVQDDVELREAFIDNLGVLQQGRVLNLDLTEALFTGKIYDYHLNLEVFLAGEAPVTNSFEQKLIDLEVTTGDIDKVTDLFNFMEVNK